MFGLFKKTPEVKEPLRNTMIIVVNDTFTKVIMAEEGYPLVRPVADGCKLEMNVAYQCMENGIDCEVRPTGLCLATKDDNERYFIYGGISKTGKAADGNKWFDVDSFEEGFIISKVVSILKEGVENARSKNN